VTSPAPLSIPGLASPWALRRLIVILVAMSGLLLGLAAPARTVAFAWPFIFAPMFIALDLALRSSSGTGSSSTGSRGGASGWRRWLRVLGCTVPVGILMGGVSGDWVEQTAYVFGGLPKALAYATAWLGYGGLLGMEVFLFIGVPFAWAHRHPRWQLALLALWPAVLQALIPRFIFWSYGQMMFPLPQLVQVADVVGSVGLNFWLLPLHWLMYALVRNQYDAGWLPRRDLKLLAGALLLAFGLSYAYGAWRLAEVAAQQAQGPRVQLVGIQPNFSLMGLASNPQRTPNERGQSLQALVSDSNKALLGGGLVPGVPVVVLWPESVYPVPYFDYVQPRDAVEQWARNLGVHLVLASIDTRQPVLRPGDNRPRIYGAAIHVAPAAKDPAVYHKLTPIPFGETVPLGDVFPWWRDLYLRLISNTSDFERGRDYTVFEIAPGVRIAPLICFDALDDGPALGMSANGATVGVVLANLAWFGPSSVSRQMKRFVSFRAIENRIPILQLSQNGESVLIDATGQPASRMLGQYEVGALSLEVHAGPGRSVFSRFAPWIHGAYALALAGVLAGFALKLRRKR
jgi:apolipoprotein N-acyltransferase